MPTSRLLASLLALAPLAAAQGSWSHGFDRSGIDGRVFALGTFGGELVAGGHLFATDGEFIQHVARFDGSAWHPLGAGLNENVRDFAVHEGELYACGAFTSSGGNAVSGIARWDGTAWRALGQGLALSWASQPLVWDIEVYGGELYATGEFNRAGGQAIVGLARWDGSAWKPAGGSLSISAGSPKGYALHAASDGRLYLGGEFDAVGGVAARNIASWDGSTWRPLGSGIVGGGVYALEEYAGEVVAAGTFGAAGGVSANKVAAWDGSSWRALDGGVGGIVVYALEVRAGLLYAGGNFSDAEGVASAPKVTAWDGSSWLGVGGVFGNDSTTTVFDLHELSGALYVGGEFSMTGFTRQVGVTKASVDVAVLDSDWSPVGGGLGTNAEVFSLSRFGTGVVATGRFTEAGDELTSTVALFESGGWRALGDFSSQVWDAAEFEGDLVVTGDFTSVDGVSAKNVARWDGTSWSAMGSGAGGSSLAVFQGQLYAGGLGAPMRWNGSSWETFGQSVFGSVYAMHEHGGLLYIAGDFNNSGGVGPNIVSWDGTTMRSLGTGTDGPVEALASFGGELIVGGRFDRAGSVSGTKIARWNGSSWQNVGPGIPNYSVYSLGVFDGELYAGGDLALGGGFVNAYLARWDGTGFVAEGGLNGSARAILGDDLAGSLWIGGFFTSVDGAPARYVSRFDLDGGAPAPTGPTLGWVGGRAPRPVTATLGLSGTLSLSVEGAQPGETLLVVAGLVPPGDAERAERRASARRLDGLLVRLAVADGDGRAEVRLSGVSLPEGRKVGASALPLEP